MLQNTFGARQMEPRFGFQVYKTSVKLFEKHPLQIFLLGLAYLFFLFVSMVSPLLVQLALAFVTPIVAIGVLRSLRLLDSTTEQVKMNQIGQVFFDQTRKEDYFILGAVNVGYTALTIVFTYTGGAGSWLSAIFGVLYIAATHFAYPLVEFDRVNPIDALKSSLQISKLNWKPAAVYALASFFFFILSLCALGVGFFIFFPLALISRYVSYQIILNK